MAKIFCTFPANSGYIVTKEWDDPILPHSYQEKNIFFPVTAGKNLYSCHANFGKSAACYNIAPHLAGDYLLYCTVLYSLYCTLQYWTILYYIVPSTQHKYHQKQIYFKISIYQFVHISTIFSINRLVHISTFSKFIN